MLHKGAIVSLYNVGQAVGTFAAGYLANKLSRRWTICISAVIGMSTEVYNTHQVVI
jgi:MFS family permease